MAHAILWSFGPIVLVLDELPDIFLSTFRDCLKFAYPQNKVNKSQVCKIKNK